MDQRNYDQPPGTETSKAVEMLQTCILYGLPAAIIPVTIEDDEPAVVMYAVNDTAQFKDDEIKELFDQLFTTGEEQVPGMLALKMCALGHEMLEHASFSSDDEEID